MHFTGTLYRNPYLPSDVLLEVTQGCTHNSCEFCTMYKDVPFRMSPNEWVEDTSRLMEQILTANGGNHDRNDEGGCT